MWTSEAGSSFQITKDTEGEKITRGTKIILHLKKDQTEYLETKRIKDLVKRHSEFIGFPIFLQVEKTEEKEVADDEPAKDKSAEEGDKDKAKIEEVDEEAEKVCFPPLGDAAYRDRCRRLRRQRRRRSPRRSGSCSTRRSRSGLASPRMSRRRSTLPSTSRCPTIGRSTWLSSTSRSRVSSSSRRSCSSPSARPSTCSRARRSRTTSSSTCAVSSSWTTARI